MRLFHLLTILFLATSAVAQEAEKKEQPDPCNFVKGNVYKLLDEWKKSCSHPLCGRIVVAEPSRGRASIAACEGKEFMSMRDDLRATVVGGGAILMGEVHDNPLHHELRSRMGFSQFGSIVLEQIDVSKVGVLDAFGKETNYQFKEGALEKLKAAVEWDKSGWQQYNYDALLVAALKGQVPIYAGDAARDAVKAAAKDGEAAVPADERARLKLDVALGEKTDAAVLDELYESHCKVMERSALGAMAFAQRYRDSVLADSVLAASAKHHSVILLAGNGHVRKDRGVPWYIQQRSPDKKMLTILLVEAEEGKTEADAYIPKDADGKPAADYVIFTPRADRKDPCEAMKAKKPE